MSGPLRLVVSMDDQKLHVFHGERMIRAFDVSTALKGMGYTKDSYRTPTGSLRICERIGEGEPAGTIFRARVPVGLWQPGESPGDDLVLTRILRLEGLDEQNANTFERCIYIHGTNREDLIGRPAGHGCVRLSNSDMIELFDLVSVGDMLDIQPVTRRRGRLLFLACDSTLSSIEGLDELARLRGDEVFRQVSLLTDAAMNGHIPLGDAFERRMALIRPDRDMCRVVSSLYAERLVPGMRDFIDEAKRDGWLPVILSCGLLPVIRPFAAVLGIDHVEAVPICFNGDGSFNGHDRAFPTLHLSGKREIIAEWKAAMLPERTVMLGDGLPDLETRPVVDAFIGFQGVLSRPSLADGCVIRMNDMTDRSALGRVMMGDFPSGS